MRLIINFWTLEEPSRNDFPTCSRSCLALRRVSCRGRPPTWGVFGAVFCHAWSHTTSISKYYIFLPFPCRMYSIVSQTWDVSSCFRINHPAWNTILFGLLCDPILILIVFWWTKVSVASLLPPPPPPGQFCNKRFPSSTGNLDDNELIARLQITICSGERGFVSPVLSTFGGRLPKSFFQTGSTSCQPQAQRRRFRSLVFFRLLWPTPRPNRCQDLQLALPQLSITPPVQPGADLCVRHISIMVPWYYVVRAAGFASAPSSVHGKRNNPSAFLWSLPSRWAIDGEFKLGQPFQPAWILAHWFLKLLSHFNARWSDRTVKLFPSSKCPIPHTIARELFRRSTVVPFRDGQRRAA